MDTTLTTTSETRKRKRYGAHGDFPDNVGLLTRYTITDVARILDVHRNTARRYVMCGLLIPINYKSKKLHFLGREVKRCWLKVMK